jgi:hypothetical protein
MDRSAPTAAPPAEREFIDLVCQDEQLLRAEFDALIAASWPTPPRPVPPAPPQRPAPLEPGRSALTADDRPTPTRHVPDADRWRRQRGPP